jgi:muramoyltetrapeptide carboxypeptidase
VDASELEPGLALLRSAGFRVVLAGHVYDRRDYLAGDDQARLEDLNSMLGRPEIRAVVCARGGYGSLRLLPGVRYDVIREDPKVIVGYSDITALLNAVHKETGLVTFHGPMVRDLGGKSRDNWDDLLRIMISGKGKTLALAPRGRALVEGKACGPLAGGNLSVLCHLAGTPFFPELEGAILFLEDIGEPGYRVDRMLTHLMLTGRIRGVSGIALGEMVDCGAPETLEDIFADILSPLGVPLATGLPVGHGDRNAALPIGLPAELDTRAMTLSF